jgi:hypothetical protein
MQLFVIIWFTNPLSSKVVFRLYSTLPLKILWNEHTKFNLKGNINNKKKPNDTDACFYQYESGLSMLPIDRNKCLSQKMADCCLASSERAVLSYIHDENKFTNNTSFCYLKVITSCLSSERNLRLSATGKRDDIMNIREQLCLAMARQRPLITSYC